MKISRSSGPCQRRALGSTVDSVKKLKSQANIRILGVMTGTSCDGLDAACIEITPSSWQPLWSETASYPLALRKRVLKFQEQDTQVPIREWLALHADLGNWYGKTLHQFINKYSKHKPDAIANHGQTLAHFPFMGQRSSTLQLGNSARIACATGLTVISGFRDGDLAAGGQGAPLVPLFTVCSPITWGQKMRASQSTI